MENLFQMIKRLIPDIDKKLYNRIDILREIEHRQPIGRRALSDVLNVSERALRQDIEELKQNDLIDVQHSGMSITSAGQYVVEYFETAAIGENRLREKSDRLAETLNIQTTHVSAGNTSNDEEQIKLIGKTVNQILSRNLPQGKNVIAVMGGTSVAHVADNLNPQISKERDLLFISGRGGMGADSAIQANVICDKMAHNTHGKSQALYTPDQMSEETYTTLMNEPEISKIISSLQKANALIFGIGDAETMISRRNFGDNLSQKLIEQDVVGEAFGEYFTASGEVVYRLNRIGLQKKDLENIPMVIAVAYGEEKATAIEAFMKNAPEHVQLVTDEGAANIILNS